MPVGDETLRILIATIALSVAACGGDGDPPVDAGVPAPDAPYPAAVECGDDPTPTGTVALPKNIIFIMGDGMGPVQVIAGGLSSGAPLSLESLSDPVYVNTDSLTTDESESPDDDPTDSAAAATAIATGVRTLNDVVGQDRDGNPLETVADLAKAEGKAVGIVTNSFVYDASPAAWYAHTVSRDNHDEILMTFVTEALPDVLFGGGREIFEALGQTYLNLATDAGYFTIRDADELAAWDPEAEPKALGLFQGNAVSEAPTLWEWFTTPVTLRDADSTDPPLPDMVDRALDALGRDPEGFFLFVENEHIDTYGHIALIKRDLVIEGLPAEVLELDAAVDVAVAWIEASSSFDETLLVVTADHETGGYIIDDGDLSEPLFWASPFHSRQPVAVYARGPGAEQLTRVCRSAHLFWLLTGQLQ